MLCDQLRARLLTWQVALHGGDLDDDGPQLAGLFDIDRSKVGRRVGALKVRHLDELAAGVADSDRVIGVVTTSAPGAQRAADALVSAGARAILNFAPASLAVGRDVWLRNVDVSVELQILAYHRFADEAGPV
ncbi:MAG: hypothetical protein ACREEO_11495, partial [Phenylobacterium sp.]